MEYIDWGRGSDILRSVGIITSLTKAAKLLKVTRDEVSVGGTPQVGVRNGKEGVSARYGGVRGH
jgi:hypothetical protein